jgi:xanthine dehydrogenase accessory factor
MTDFWEALLHELEAGHAAVLLYVLHSEGSSPGRQGFRMFVGASGRLRGSIGGGVMEHKWVAYCQAQLLGQAFRPFCKKQIHKPEGTDRSGMICSGEQTIAFYPSEPHWIPVLRQALRGNSGRIVLQSSGLSWEDAETGDVGQPPYRLAWQGEQWRFDEWVGPRRRLHIVGGGHVGIALRQLASWLGFDVRVYDNRPELHTFAEVPIQERVLVPSYGALGQYLPPSPADRVAIMTFGYRTDLEALLALQGRKYAYIGMMGSRSKLDRLWEEARAAGVREDWLAQVRAPIGLPIGSQTPAEIAVSVMAEVLALRERGNPPSNL